MAVLVIYAILGYWATGRTIYRNRILIGTWKGIFYERLVAGLFLGIILIPWAIITLFTDK